jgi:transcriptional regulator with GAF, ATPase, and Fis domain
VESKLFGHQKGSFTGAVKDAQGCFEMADHGALLLDEIGELPLEAQVHLLRVIQEGCIQRVGSSVDIPVDVRLITATNRDLFEMTRTKKFRSDLFYRLNVFPIFVPPLRERRQDIPVLLDFFIGKMCRRFGLSESPELSEADKKDIVSYDWPGNIRELQNAVTKAMIMWSGNRDVPFRLEFDRFWGEDRLSGTGGTEQVLMARAEAPVPGSTLPCPPGAAGERSDKEDFATMEEMERRHIQRALKHCSGRINGKGGAAQLLGMAPSTLRARIKKLGISRRG